MPKRLMFLPFPYATHGAGIWIPTFASKITQLGKYTSTIFRIWDSLPLKDFRCLPLSDSRRGCAGKSSHGASVRDHGTLPCLVEGCWGYSRGSQSLLVNDFEANRKSLFEGGWSNMKQHEATTVNRPSQCWPTFTSSGSTWGNQHNHSSNHPHLFWWF